MSRATVSRREFIAIAAGAAATTGIEGMVAARRAPAYAQGARLQLLQWSHYVPAADTLFESQAREFGKQAGAEIRIERRRSTRRSAHVEDCRGRHGPPAPGHHPGGEPRRRLFDRGVVHEAALVEATDPRGAGANDARATRRLFAYARVLSQLQPT